MATLNAPARGGGRHARPLLVVATLVAALAVSFLPAGPARVVALTAADPSASPVSDPAPTPVPDPTAALDPTPVPDPTPSPASDPTPSPEPTPTADPSTSPGPSASPDPSPSPTPLPPGTVGPEGGTIGGAGVWVQVSPGALASPTALSLRAAGGMPDFDGAPSLAGYALGAADAASGDPLVVFGAGVALRVPITSIDLGGADPADLRIARFDRAWSVLATTNVDGVLVSGIPGPGLYGVVEVVSAGPADGEVTQTTDAPDRGRHRVDPGGLLAVEVDSRALRKLRDARLTELIPPGWAVVVADGGSVDASIGEISWSSRTVRAGTSTAHRIVLRAPLVSPDDGRPAFTALFQARIGHRGGQAMTPPITVLVAPPVVVGHTTLAEVDAASLAPVYLPEDAAIPAQQRYMTFRIRFQVRNADSTPVDWTPQLDVRATGNGTFAVVPSLRRVDGVPFYVTREWQRLSGGDGTELGPESEAIGGDQLRSHDTDDSNQAPAVGIHSMGENPLPTFSLAPLSYTEIEFSVRATVDAVHSGLYEFRVTDAGRDFTGARTAWVRMGPKPAVELTPGQRAGVPVAGSPPDVARVAAPATYAGSLPRIQGAALAGGVAYALGPGAISGLDRGLRYALDAAAAPPAPAASLVSTAAGAAAGMFVSPHTAYSLTSDTCGACHRAHVAQGSNLLAATAPQANLCLSCHDGTGASTNVAARYADASLPANDPTTASIYRHDALVPTSHTRSGQNEFQDASGQPILNRHSECSDCHEPHRATSTESAQTSTGWTLSGREDGISGVAVTNGAAGSAPSYTFLDGKSAPATREYQLCLKCHSGFTTLPARQAGAPSQWAIDKGGELNPANLSYHPVEAPGRNATSAMAASLSGTSPFKLWTFTTGSTVRCVNCHGDPSTLAAGTPPSAGSDLAPHVSPYRSLLLANYRDRVLEQGHAAYDATDFALCYLCHAEAPYRDVSGDWRTDTNFSFHGYHVSGLSGMGPGGTSIDTAGHGGGNAICAECHFRIHSTASRNDFRTGTQQTGTDGGLVVFAPDVTSDGGTLSWVRTGEGSGSCTLSCHGQSHHGEGY